MSINIEDLEDTDDKQQRRNIVLNGTVYTVVVPTIDDAIEESRNRRSTDDVEKAYDRAMDIL